jgi:hypothetical protein
MRIDVRSVNTRISINVLDTAASTRIFGPSLPRQLGEGNGHEDHEEQRGREYTGNHRHCQTVAIGHCPMHRSQ